LPSPLGLDASRLDARIGFADRNRLTTGDGIIQVSEKAIDSDLVARARKALGKRDLVFVGLMGAGKSAIGKMTAQNLDIPFIDSDHEIERVSRMTINELFSSYGEPEFRALETRVIERLLKTGPRVISTGGGAYANENTRRVIRNMGALTIWINADLETLWARVSKRDNRPLLKTANPRETLANLMTARYPIYAEADIEVLSRDARKEVITREVLEAVAAHPVPAENAAPSEMEEEDHAG
jgi:shikimate kinase